MVGENADNNVNSKPGKVSSRDHGNKNEKKDPSREHIDAKATIPDEPAEGYFNHFPMKKHEGEQLEAWFYSSVHCAGECVNK